MEAVPFPVEPVFQMRPGLERCPGELSDHLSPVSPPAFTQAQQAVELALNRKRLPLVMSFDGQTQTRAGCLQALQAARIRLVDDQAEIGAAHGAPEGLPACALALRRSIQDDFVLMVPDGADAPVPGMLRAAVLSVAAPSGWDPAGVVGLDFARIHRPVPEAALIQSAAVPLSRLMLDGAVWRRFVWTLSETPELSQHPADQTPGSASGLDEIYFRSERQLLVPLPGHNAVIFLIRVFVAPLSEVLSVDPARAGLLRQSLQSMSPAVLSYKRLAQVKELVLAALP